MTTAHPPAPDGTPVCIGATYRHYKFGALYRVICHARHSETQEDLIVYRLADDTGPIWARPARMWHQRLLVNGELVARFTPIETRPAGGGRGEEGGDANDSDTGSVGAVRC